MLIVGPNSTCDVCMESYKEVAGMPHAISCGHIFCRKCLDWMQPQCPFCRDEFSPKDIRKLLVDNDSVPSPTTTAPQVDAQVQCLLDDIAKTADGGATVEEMERVVDLCSVYHTAQPDCIPHTPLGADQLSELAATRDDIRDRLTLELDAARLEHQNSEQARHNEQEAARKNEEAFRVHYDKMNALWKRSVVESTKQKYQALREELHQLRQTSQPAAHGKTSSVIAAIQRRTIATGNFSGVMLTLDKVELPAFPLSAYLILIFNIMFLVAWVGYFLFSIVSTVVLPLCAK